jgi:hypothetical protein
MPAASVAVLYFNVMIALTNGADAGQTLVIGGIGLAAGMVTGGLLSGIGGIWAAMASGVVSSVVSNTISNALNGRSLGDNMLESAAIGALSSAISYGIEQGLSTAMSKAAAGIARLQAAQARAAGGAAAEASDATSYLMEERAFLASAPPGHTMLAQEMLPPYATEDDIDAVDPLSGAPMRGNRGQLGWGLTMVGVGIGLGGGALALELIAGGAGTLGAEALTQLTMSIGRLGAPAAAFLKFGYEYLEICEQCWSLTRNAMIIRNAIENGYRFYLASEPSLENFWNAVEGRPTVFWYEFMQIITSGYKLVGNYLIRE